MTAPSLTFDRRGQIGFTLIEMLLAVALLAMVLALAYGGLRTSIRAAARGEVVIENTSHMRIVHQFMRRQLSQMLPLPYVSDEDERVMFEAGPDFIQFVAPMPGYLGLGGPHVQRIELVRGQEGDDLIYQHGLLRDYAEFGFGDRDPVLLIEGIDSASFSYLFRQGRDAQPEWLNAWDQPEVLPLAVEIDLLMTDELQAEWPVLTTAMRVDGAGFFSNALRGRATTIEELRERMRGRRNRN